MPRWNGDGRFHTFTRCRPVKQEPAKPTGKATASQEALQRWAQDSWRYSPYQYEEDLLVWKGEQWRCLNANERLAILGFPKGYLEAPQGPLTEDAKCELAGDVMAVKVISRLLASLPESPGAWPPLPLSVVDQKIVVTDEPLGDGATVPCRSGPPLERPEEAKDGSNDNRHVGSTPGHPAFSPAMNAQTPGHIGSNPAERANGEARLPRDGELSRQPPGHLCSIPAERAPDPLDEEIAQWERYERALLQQRQEEQYWAEQRAKQERVAALRARCEALEQASPLNSSPAVPHASPRMASGIESNPFPGLGPRWAWENSRSVPNMEDPGRPPHGPPGLEVLWRVPPSAARVTAPPKREMLSAKVASSGVKSPYYSEYRQGRVPGSPGLDQLRAQANLANAPSQFSACWEHSEEFV